jgi:NAD(P)-dependent dehydrogenase (short-subunit alcohol dehydrogenase family)
MLEESFFRRFNHIIFGFACGLIRSAPRRLAESVTRMYPMGKLGAPVDVAECALCLAPDASSFVTGASFVVDGGLMAGRKVRARVHADRSRIEI